MINLHERMLPTSGNSVVPLENTPTGLNKPNCILVVNPTFAIKYVNLYQQSGASNLIGLNLKWAWHLNLFSRTRVNNTFLPRFIYHLRCSVM